jgi:hypothetical protein
MKMIKKIISKKADMSMPLFVGLVVIITSFLVLLYFWLRLDPGGITDKEICHNSVVLKDKSKAFAGSLDCRTNYVCISGGGDCLDSGSKVKVEASDEEQIMKVLADEMSSCWYMFGEGKESSYADGIGGWNPTKVYCSVCSIVQFDKKIQEKTLKITYSKFYNYLAQTKKDDSQTYLEYLYGVSNLNSLEIQKQFGIVSVKDDFLATKEKYSIITGIDSNTNNDNIDEGPLDNEVLKVYIIPTIETPATSCTEFLTKA